MVEKFAHGSHYFAKHDPGAAICEKITRLNILANQFYPALAIFSPTFPPSPPPPPPPQGLLKELVAHIVYYSLKALNTVYSEESYIDDEGRGRGAVFMRETMELEGDV